MLKALSPLIDSGVINEDTRSAIQEAWEVQLTEAKETVRAELREEFARRYEHDKGVMVEALDKLVTDSLRQEIVEFTEEKQALAAERKEHKVKVRETTAKIRNSMNQMISEEVAELHSDRVKNKIQMRENTAKFIQFMSKMLAEEIKALRADRNAQNESIERLEQFVSKSLKKEIVEFAQDKREIVETKVRLIAGAKKKLSEMQQSFIARSSQLVKESVTKSLAAELSQLREDIQVARENMFGRRLFEAFASEFSVTHLNESKELAKLQSLVDAKNRQLAEAKATTQKAVKLAESKSREVQVLNEDVKRQTVMAELLGPLNKEKATIMGDLLESVRTDKLRSAYDKYLPAVLNGGKSQPTASQKVLTESRKEVTGDKTAAVAVLAIVEQEFDNVVELRRLAGLTK